MLGKVRLLKAADGGGEGAHAAAGGHGPGHRVHAHGTSRGGEEALACRLAVELALAIPKDRGLAAGLGPGLRRAARG